MKIRLLYVIPYYLPDVQFGGPVFSVSALCESLVAQGFDVTVYTIGYKEEQQYPFVTQLNGVEVHYFKPNYGKPCQVSFQLWNALRQNASQFHVVHLQTWWNILIFRSLLILRGRGPKVVLSSRGMMSNYSFTHRKTFVKKLFQSSIGIGLLNGVELHATSAAEAKEMANRCNRFQDSIHIIPNLLNLHFAEKPAMATSGFRIGFLSRLHHKKGIEILLQAVAKCPFIDELVIGGRGEEAYEALLHRTVADLGIADRVSFAGWIDHADKQVFFDRFHLMVLPSFNENFANVVVEAWAAGKPVIISNEVGLSDFVLRYDAGWICDPNVEGLCETLELAFDCREMLPEMAENALALVQHSFGDAQIVGRYKKLYQLLANNKGELAIEPVVSWPETAAENGEDENKIWVLGLNAHHADASAALYCNGQLLAAAEEERFRRVKHWAGFPSQAISYCLEEAGISISSVQHIVVGRDSSAKLFKKAKFLIQYPDALTMALKGRLSNAGQNLSVQNALKAMPGAKEGWLPRIAGIEHHRSHLASAFFPSPFTEAALLSVDGSGDFTTTMMGVGNQLEITVLQTQDFPHSLGIFYTAFTQLLGFPHYGDEYKVMGLSGYGKPVYFEKLKPVITWLEEGSFALNTEYFKTPGRGYIRYDRDHRPQVPQLFSDALERLFGPARKLGEPITQYHKDLAASVQMMLEETLFMMLNWLHEKTGLTKLCMAGGVSQNSLANGKIRSRTPFTDVFIPPAGHDAGLALGSALYWQHQVLGLGRKKQLEPQAYTGKSYSQGSIGHLLQQRKINARFITSYNDLCHEVADCIANGGVVGWFRGKSEFGPRALGNRSILADPRRADATELLNLKIKKREPFRPFAPSVLKEAAQEWFDGPDDVPFMEKVYPVTREKRALVPAVTHVDGTGRLQTVSQQTNPDFYRLIDSFYRKTGIPMLLNTSFNENEPIVNSPAEALDCFLRTKMDMLVLENYVVVREPD